MRESIIVINARILKVIIFATTLGFFSSCSNNESEVLNSTNDSLLAQTFEKDTAIEQFIVAFNDIETNLDSVAALQQNLYLNTDQPNEFIPNKKDNINKKIDAINKLMVSNRLKIASLTSAIESSKYKNSALVKTIATLNKQLLQKDSELALLNQKLGELNVQVTELNVALESVAADNRSKNELLVSDMEIMHTAYYIVGKKNTLIKANIINRNGGLLGIGRTSKLRANLNTEMFNKIDITNVKIITIGGHAKILTTHPTASYQLVMGARDEKSIEQIRILDVDLFWSISKYLVVIKD